MRPAIAAAPFALTSDLGSNPGDRPGGPAHRLRPGNAQDAFARRLEQGLSLGVLLPRNRVVVPRGAIGFHNDVLVGPTEVRDHTPAAK